jgi:phage N-6-adenine-methyltransferase
MTSLTKPVWWSSDHWATPPSLVAELEAEFGRFDLDPCCRAETAKAPAFYTEADDGLSKPWHGTVFLNPPYSKPAPWLRKAIEETTSGAAVLVVALLPVRTDTRWFHALVKGRAEIRFIQGRIKWIGWQGTPIPHPQDPNMVAFYRSESAHKFPKESTP